MPTHVTYYIAYVNKMFLLLIYIMYYVYSTYIKISSNKGS